MLPGQKLQRNRLSTPLPSSISNSGRVHCGGSPKTTHANLESPAIATFRGCVMQMQNPRENAVAPSPCHDADMHFEEHHTAEAGRGGRVMEPAPLKTPSSTDAWPTRRRHCQPLARGEDIPASGKTSGRGISADMGDMGLCGGHQHQPCIASSRQNVDRSGHTNVGRDF